MKSKILFFFLIAVMIAACKKIEPETGAAPAAPEPDDAVVTDAPDEPAQADDPPAAAYTAKERFADAESLIIRRAPDAIFVGASAEMDSSGNSPSWAFSFDSRQKSKGYEVEDGIIRERQFSFQEGITVWVDSTVAAEACGAGAAVLESGQWTVTSDGRTCEADAKTGELHEQ